MSMDERPLNVWSRSEEEIGRLMSNFAHTPFRLDDVEYASVEGFYASLMFTADVRRRKVAGLWGIRAKHEIPKVKPAEIRYRDECYGLGSSKHIGLIKRAIRAKLEANPEIARAFVETRSRPIAHETGHPDPPGAEFPKETLCRILTELREEFAASDHS